MVRSLTAADAGPSRITHVFTRKKEDQETDEGDKTMYTFQIYLKLSKADLANSSAMCLKIVIETPGDDDGTNVETVLYVSQVQAVGSPPSVTAEAALDEFTSGLPMTFSLLSADATCADSRKLESGEPCVCD
jgi:hypothetical protein